jgi:hypothetical protein
MDVYLYISLCIVNMTRHFFRSVTLEYDPLVHASQCVSMMTMCNENLLSKTVLLMFDQRFVFEEQFTNCDIVTFT